MNKKQKTLEEITNEQQVKVQSDLEKSIASIEKMTQRLNDAKTTNQPNEEIARLEELVKLHTDNKERISKLDINALATEKFDRESQKFTRDLQR